MVCPCVGVGASFLWTEGLICVRGGGGVTICGVPLGWSNHHKPQPVGVSFVG